MRALIVVVQAILVDDRLEVALVDNQHPVEAFLEATPDPALGISILPLAPSAESGSPRRLAMGRPDRLGTRTSCSDRESTR